MSRSTVHFESLLGKMVHDSQGAKAGRIFSVHAEIDGEDCVVREYRLGKLALLERLGIPLSDRRKPLRVPWDLLDIGDPERPRLRCSLDELPGRR